MTLKQITTALKSTGYPVAYNHFETEQTAPYIIYYVGSTNNIKASDNRYVRVDNLVIELYTATKNETAEALLESKLDAVGLNNWSRAEDYFDDQKIYINTYEMEVIR